MKIRAQIAMVMNLDKCIGCHTCSVTCKNVWTSREGVEYAWFNNVETKPGIGYPKEWENQDKWNGGWRLTSENELIPLIGGKWRILSALFSNPCLPSIDDYYEPFTFNYDHLQKAPISVTPPTARSVSVISGKYIYIKNTANWEEILGGEFSVRGKDYNFKNMEKNIQGEFENTFMLYLPRICNHCLNPACIASCPSGAIYKRNEDGIVLVDQDKCRGWRMCISGCPYKKIYYNWKSGKSEKCTFCYPRIESGMTTVCSETCVGRIRYVGVMLYDADKIRSIAMTKETTNIYNNHLNIFLDPFDKTVISLALKNNIQFNWIEAAQNSPVYKMAIEWKIAFPLHPEYRTLPMIWYIPPLSPIQNNILVGKTGDNGILPDISSLRIPAKYLANLLTAGDTKPIILALKRMMVMRSYMRNKHVDKKEDNLKLLESVNLTIEQIKDMYKYMAIANYYDRFVIPTAKTECYTDDSFSLRSGIGFDTDGDCEYINVKGINNRRGLFGGA